MKKLLESLNFSAKEATVYLALLESGTQAASYIARKVGYPKSTVLFLFDGLLKRGYIRKSNRGRVQYFYADPEDLKKVKERKIQEEQETLQKTIPLLKECKSPFSSEPKVTFFEGIDGCKRAYAMILESSTEVMEFGAHGDLVKKFGEDFMDDFIAKRAGKKIFLKAIAKKDSMHKKLSALDKEHLREIQFYAAEKGDLYSSIAIFEDKVLLLNLFRDAFAILIENKEVAETLKTIFRLQWR